jgi:hypothetical protein
MSEVIPDSQPQLLAKVDISSGAIFQMQLLGNQIETMIVKIRSFNIWQDCRGFHAIQDNRVSRHRS